MANAFGVRYNPHVWGTGIGLAANLQLMAVLPHNPLSMSPVEPLLEFDHTEHPFRLELLTEPIQHTEGWVQIPTGPGLGIEIQSAVVEKYEVKH